MRISPWMLAGLAVCLTGCRTAVDPFGLVRGDGYRPGAVQAADGSWRLSGQGYTAEVNRDGYLASLRVGTVETLGAPFACQPEAKLVADRAEMAGSVLKVHLQGPGGEATIDYRFRRDGVTIVPVWRGSGAARCEFTASPELLGFELMTDTPVIDQKGVVQVVQRGDTRGMPAPESACGQTLRLHFPGFALYASGGTWGALYGGESVGVIRDAVWTRPLPDAGRPYPMALTIQPNTNRARLPAPVFSARPAQPGGVYRPDEPYVCILDFGQGKSIKYLTDAGIGVLVIEWQVMDVYDRTIAIGMEMVRLDPDQSTIAKPVTVKAPDAQYCEARFRVFEPSGIMLPASVRTWFTIARDGAASTATP